MQAIWYGDRRDRVKWGGLIHLAEQNNIQNIIQVVYYREGHYPVLNSNDGSFPLSDAVWKHFSDLNNIQRLAQATGRSITVFDHPFEPDSRREYIAQVIAELVHIKSPKIVFLDPDTGLSFRSPRPEHVTEDDLQEIWEALQSDDILVVYQHAARSKDWLERRSRELSEICCNTEVRTITSAEVAKDVALLWCKK